MSELHIPYEDEQTVLIEQLLQPRPVVIGIEGGPCGGKSTLLAEVERQAATIGRTIVVLPEVATNHIRTLQQSGKEVSELMVEDRPAYIQFQQTILKDIITGLEEAIIANRGTDALVVADRCDIGAYVTRTEHEHMLRGLGQTEAPMSRFVDQLYYLPSVASESPWKYDQLRSTNPARYENADQARKVCQSNLATIQHHPELHIAWGGDFEEKIKRVASSIIRPEIEVEVKQEESSETAAQKIEDATQKGNLLHVHDIHQSYHQLHDYSFRLRKTTDQRGTTTYFFAIKNGYGISREEIQRTLTQEEYELLRATPMIGNELHKYRHVILDEANESSTRRRLWFGDQYQAPQLPVWHFETDVDNEDEIEELDVLYSGTRKRLTTSAKDLIYV